VPHDESEQGHGIEKKKVKSRTRRSPWTAEETALVVHVALSNPENTLHTISTLCHQMNATFERPGDAVRKKLTRLLGGRPWSSLEPKERERLLEKSIDQLKLRGLIVEVKRQASRHIVEVMGAGRDESIGLEGTGSGFDFVTMKQAKRDVVSDSDLAKDLLDILHH